MTAKISPELTVAFPNATRNSDPNAIHHIQKVNKKINIEISKEIKTAMTIGNAGNLMSLARNLFSNFFHEPQATVRTGVFQILHTNFAAPIMGTTPSAANVNFWNEGIVKNQGPNPILQHANNGIFKLDKNIADLFDLAHKNDLKKSEKKTVEKLTHKTEKEIGKVEKKLDKAEKKLEKNEAQIQSILSNPGVDSNLQNTLKNSLNDIQENKKIIQTAKAQLQEQKHKLPKF